MQGFKNVNIEHKLLLKAGVDMLENKSRKHHSRRPNDIPYRT